MIDEEDEKKLIEQSLASNLQLESCSIKSSRSSKLDSCLERSAKLSSLAGPPAPPSSSGFIQTSALAPSSLGFSSAPVPYSSSVQQIKSVDSVPYIPPQSKKKKKKEKEATGRYQCCSYPILFSCERFLRYISWGPYLLQCLQSMP